MMLPGLPTIRLSSSVKLTFNGNSLFAGTGASSSTYYLPNIVAANLTATGVSMANVSSAGLNWQQLDSSTGANVDGQFNGGQTNILVLWEHTNDVYNIGRTAAQTIADMQTHINNRKAAHPGWKIALLSALPRQVSGSLSSTITNNGVLDTVNALCAANYRTYGIDLYIDLRRAGSPWALPDYTDASFALTNAYMDATEVAGNARVHCNDAGYTLIAGWVTQALRHVRKR